MFDEPPPPSPFPHGPNPERKGDPRGPQPGAGQTQQFQHTPTSARVPEKAARGVFATGVLIIHNPNEFVLDFIQAMGRATLVARIVMNPVVAEQLLSTLQENYGRYVNSFGQPPSMPKPPPERPKTAQEIYDELRISDEMLSGVYTNACMVGHTPAEFHVDFMTHFFPHAAVCSRVYIAAPRMPQLIETLGMSVGQWKKAREAQQQRPQQG